MKKLKYLLSMLLCMLFLFVGCAVPADNAARQKNVSEATTVADNKLPNPNQEVTISDEVVESVEDTEEIIEQGKGIATDEIIEGSIAQEKSVNDEGLLETDGTVEQENISYDGTNTGIGKDLLSGTAKLTYYSQADSRWGSVLYTNHGDKSQTMKSSGCGPTSAAMAVSASKGIITPLTMKKLFEDNGYRTYSNGTAWSAWSFVADFFDFKEYKPTSSFKTMASYLKQDKNKDGISDYFVVLSCANGLFTTGGHYIFSPGWDFQRNCYIIYDPYYYPGKFDTGSRRAAGVKVSGNIAYVSEKSMKKYGNIQQIWLFSNDSNSNKQSTDKKDTGTTTANNIIKYVCTQSSPLNVRSGAGKNYKILASMPRGTKVTVSKTSGGWSYIISPYKGWVDSQYLSKTKPSTVKVAYVYIPATGRLAYCNYSAIEKYNGYYRLRANTTLYSKSNLTGTQYTYLAKTKVVIKKTI